MSQCVFTMYTMCKTDSKPEFLISASSLRYAWGFLWIFDSTVIVTPRMRARTHTLHTVSVSDDTDSIGALILQPSLVDEILAKTALIEVHLHV